jgi:hypothetical protein
VTRSQGVGGLWERSTGTGQMRLRGTQGREGRRRLYCFHAGTPEFTLESAGPPALTPRVVPGTKATWGGYRQYRAGAPRKPRFP